MPGNIACKPRCAEQKFSARILPCQSRPAVTLRSMPGSNKKAESQRGEFGFDSTDEILMRFRIPTLVLSRSGSRVCSQFRFVRNTPSEFIRHTALCHCPPEQVKCPVQEINLVFTIFHFTNHRAGASDRLMCENIRFSSSGSSRQGKKKSTRRNRIDSQVNSL